MEVLKATVNVVVMLNIVPPHSGSRLVVGKDVPVLAERSCRKIV